MKRFLSSTRSQRRVRQKVCFSLYCWIRTNSFWGRFWVFVMGITSVIGQQVFCRQFQKVRWVIRSTVFDSFTYRMFISFRKKWFIQYSMVRAKLAISFTRYRESRVMRFCEYQQKSGGRVIIVRVVCVIFSCDKQSKVLMVLNRQIIWNFFVFVFGGFFWEVGGLFFSYFLGFCLGQYYSRERGFFRAVGFGIRGIVRRRVVWRGDRRLFFFEGI